jgi:hypothetical protein
VNHKIVLLHQLKNECSKLSGACQVYCCIKLACDVTDFEAYASLTEGYPSYLPQPTPAVVAARLGGRWRVMSGKREIYPRIYRGLAPQTRYNRQFATS